MRHSDENHPDHDHTDHPHELSHPVPHRHFHAHHGEAPRSIVRAIAITFVFLIIETIGGFVANSLALLSDAGHLLTDIGALLLSLFSIWVARRPKTAVMSFGYHRAEILGALASGLMIWLIAGLLIFEAIMRIRQPEEVHGKVVFFVAAIGLLANLVTMAMLRSERHENINVRAAYLHILADSLGSVGAVIAGLVLWLTDWRPIDPIVTIFFAILMLYSSWSLVKEAVEILMESTPSGVNPNQVKLDLQAIAHVQEVHDLHIWSVSTGRLALSVHLIAEKPEEILSAANALLRSRYGIIHTTIQVEHPDRFSSERCYDCQ